jgi:hypothetical protein
MSCFGYGLADPREHEEKHGYLAALNSINYR